MSLLVLNLSVGFSFSSRLVNKNDNNSVCVKVRFLQEQARKVLEDARLNALLHQTSCNFKKIPGSTYYVYKQRKYPDKEFISMISPEVTNHLIMSQGCTVHSRRGGGGVRSQSHPRNITEISILKEL